jgi:segregation and condensation protein A
MQNTWTVHIKEFDGPFNLLLDLIKNQKLDITEISLSNVTGKFIDYIKTLKENNLEISSEFILVASSLLNIKAMSILNIDQRTPEMQKDYDLLFSHLLQYNAFKELGVEFAIKMAFVAQEFPRQFTPPKNSAKTPELKISVNNFYELHKQFIVPKTVSIQHLRIPRINTFIERKKIIKMLNKKKSLSFNDIIYNVKDQLPYVIVRFLIILDLFKENKILLEQKTTFTKLTINLIESKV